MESIENPELRLAFDFVQFTNRNVFLTGKAGTGKTTFLHNLKKISPKRMIVVAPTGVAAINAGGVTIHSFFQLPFHPHIPYLYTNTGISNVGEEHDQPAFKISRDKIRIMKSLDLLVIDEISMVRADLLDAVDAVLRRYKDRQRPFGGVQLLMIGDLQQLAPVVKEDDWEILGRFYDTAFFFGSLAIRSTDYVTIELKHVYRQRDATFIALLNKIRDNQMDEASFRELNSRYNPEFNPGSDDGYITLTTHNAQAQTINDSKLGKLPGKPRCFKAEIKDEFPEYAYPTLLELYLKTGAQVMFVKNDISPEKQYFNGKIGRIGEIDYDSILVTCPGDDTPIEVRPVEWQNMKYSLDEETREIRETVIGTFVQYPLRLAWAITIHKSQGLTFDKAIIDARAAFAHGQVYVALSRCRTLEGLVLSTPVGQRGIINDATVSGFAREAEQNQPDQGVLEASKKAYHRMLLDELFDFNAILYGIQYGKKLVTEHQESLLGNLHSALGSIAEHVKSDLIGISGKFNNQLQRLFSQDVDAETNAPLQERVQKACDFFGAKLSACVIDELSVITVEADNKAVRKSVSDAIDRVLQDASAKLSCLDACKPGFTIKTYLDAKAKAAVEIPKVKPRQVKSVEDNTGIAKHPVLLSRLKAWRNLMADNMNVPHYMVLPQKTMVTLANFLPVTPASLKTVKGMGKKKTEQFGAALLEIIVDYCNEKNIESTPVENPKEAPAKIKTDTKRISFDLFQTGKTVAQIASEREMAITTIEGHLAEYVGTGAIPVNDVVSPDKLALITGYFEETEDLRLGPAKTVLGDDVSWGDLRFVLKHLEYNRKTDPD